MSNSIGKKKLQNSNMINVKNNFPKSGNAVDQLIDLAEAGVAAMFVCSADTSLCLAA